MERARRFARSLSHHLDSPRRKSPRHPARPARSCPSIGMNLTGTDSRPCPSDPLLVLTETSAVGNARFATETTLALSHQKDLCVVQIERAYALAEVDRWRERARNGDHRLASLNQKSGNSARGTGGRSVIVSIATVLTICPPPRSGGSSQRQKNGPARTRLNRIGRL